MRPELQPQSLPSTSASTSAVRPVDSGSDPGDVDVLVDGRVARLAGGEEGDDHGADGDRQVEEEDRAPGDVLGQRAADRRPDRERQRRDAGPQADRLAALSGRERRRDDRQGAGHHERAADALERAARDEPFLSRREADQRARAGEHDHAEQEHPAAAEDVAEPAARDEQHRERQRVRVDGPLERRDRRAEVVLDRRQRDVHDRVVEHDHEQREAHGRERPPLAVLFGQTEAFGHGVSFHSTSVARDHGVERVGQGLAFLGGDRRRELDDRRGADRRRADRGSRAPLRSRGRAWRACRRSLRPVPPARAGEGRRPPATRRGEKGRTGR